MSFDFAKDPLRTLKPTSIEQRLDFLAERIAAVEKGQVPLGELPDLVEELGRELRSFTTIKQEIEAIREGVPEKLAEALAATLKGSAIQLRPLLERAERTERQVGHLGDAIKALSNRPAVVPVPGEDGGTAGAFATLRRDLLALESSLSDRLTGLSGAITKLAEAPLLPPPPVQPALPPRGDAPSERALVALAAEVAQLRELVVESARGDKAVVINPASGASTGAIVDTLTAMRRDLEMLSQVNVAERTAPVIRAELDDLHQLLSREIDRIGQNQTELTSRLESLAGLAGPRRRSWSLVLGLIVGAAIGGIAVLTVIGLLPGNQTRQVTTPPPAVGRVPEAPARSVAPAPEPQRIQPAPAPPAPAASTPPAAAPTAKDPAAPAPPPTIETPRRRLVPGPGEQPKVE